MSHLTQPSLSPSAPELAVLRATHDCHGISASPNSSEEIESHRGTPATKLSAFSPDGSGENLKAGGHGIIRSNVPPAFNLVHNNAHFGPSGQASDSTPLVPQDPFISISASESVTQPTTGVSKLSPAASNFTPATSIGFTSSHGLLVPISSRHDSAPDPNCPVSQLASSSSHSTKVMRKCVNSGLPGLWAEPTTFQAANINEDVCSPAGTDRDRNFSSDHGFSRVLMLSQIAPTTSTDEIYGLFGVRLAYSNDRALTNM